MVQTFDTALLQAHVTALTQTLALPEEPSRPACVEDSFICGMLLEQLKNRKPSASTTQRRALGSLGHGPPMAEKGHPGRHWPILWAVSCGKKKSFLHRAKQETDLRTQDTSTPKPRSVEKWLHNSLQTNSENQRITAHPPPRAPLGDTRPLRKQLPSPTESGALRSQRGRQLGRLPYRHL